MTLRWNQCTTLALLMFLSTVSHVLSAVPEFKVMTAASAVAARTDRRPDAGGVYDPISHQTFIAWSGLNEDTYVQAYNGSSWTVPARIADGLGDSHNYPMLVMTADYYPLIVYGFHNVRTVVRRAPKPHSIDGNWTEIDVPEGAAASYPFPVTTRQGKIFVFYRETAKTLNKTAATDFRPIKYIVSEDNGNTWKNSVQLTGKQWAFGSNGRTDHMDEVYIGQVRYVPELDTIDIVYTISGGGPTQHKHDLYHRNVYYVGFNTQNGHFYSAAGKDLGTQVDDNAQESFLKIVETTIELPGGNKSPDYILLVGRQQDQHPFVLWMQFDDSGAVLNYAAAYESNTGSWSVKQVASGLRTKDMEPLGGGLWRVYATHGTGVETFLTRDGKSWDNETTIPIKRSVQRIEVITNYQDPARILATGAATDRNVSVPQGLGDIYVAGL